MLFPKSFLGVVAGASEARWRENRSMDRGERKRKKNSVPAWISTKKLLSKIVHLILNYIYIKQVGVMLESVRMRIWKRRNGNWGTHGRIGMR